MIHITIQISGKVQGYDGKAIEGIKISAYHDTELVSYDYAYKKNGQESTYMLDISLPPGTPITLRFDIHGSLTTASEWHPSVVANIDTNQNVVLNRFLMRVGHIDNQIAAIDVLTAYQFCAQWTAMEPHKEHAQQYAESAWSRLSSTKFTLPVLQEIQYKLIEFFRNFS
ncbi:MULTISPECIES: hypothetical protein [Bacillus]|uniref:hypothetical protein n=1 Tax=Bacillus TaxID=1386 RepID=UPI00032E64DC|nr:MULTISPECIES: hypothetical protein [Bacillus cereus group]EOP29564.1 hypothetical protein IIS_05242 [Bacillus cereus VD131]MBJ8043954.1 hypothetical protein [Bacillus cereus group sp. N17]MCU5305105.1 hypothetical protein [Bacillus toyonensis]MCU5728012.1 hypothetical protein [Bacillus toyonensis]MDD9264283.1 hypothetical protein [Bacillus toyonensis]